MDPEQILSDLRSLATAIIDDLGSKAYLNPAESDAVEMAERFQALDGWLTARGFLPAGWAHPQPVLHNNAPSESEMAEIEAASDRAGEAARAEGKIDG